MISPTPRAASARPGVSRVGDVEGEAGPRRRSASPPVRPSGVSGTPCCWARATSRSTSSVGHGDDGAGDGLGEEGDEGVAVCHVRHRDRDPDPVAEAGLRQGLGQSAVGQVVGAGDDRVARRVGQQLGQRALGSEVDLRRQTAEVAVHDVRPLRAGELVAGLAEQEDLLALGDEAGRDALGDVLDDPEHGDDRRGQDGRLAGLVVEADVAAGHRDAELEAGVLQPAARLGELPHHVGVLGRAEVEAVRDGQRSRAAGGDVAVGLRQGELGTGVGVELGEAAVAVGGDRDTEVGVGRRRGSSRCRWGCERTVLPRT